MTGRRGFTLVELIIVTVLGSLVLLAAMQVLITNQRTYTAQAATVSGQQTTRMAVEIMFAELREVSPPGGDLLVMGGDSITVRLMRRFSYACAVTTGATPVVTVIKTLDQGSGGTLQIMGGTNRFEVGDSVFLFADNNQNTVSDDVWLPLAISAMDSTSILCPQNLDAGIALSFGGQLAAFVADSVRVGAPIRSYKQFTFGTTLLNGDRYLARRDTGDFVPIAGPLAATNGLQFIYRDSLGVVTNVPSQVAQIEVTVRTGSQVLDSRGNLVQDSVQVWIHTRN